MAMMVPLIEESKLQEKKGWESLNRGTSMVLLVSALFFLYFYQVAVDRHPDDMLLLVFRARWPWLGRSKIVTGL